jgi:hypothetical protein
LLEPELDLSVDIHVTKQHKAAQELVLLKRAVAIQVEQFKCSSNCGTGTSCLG